MSVNATEAKLYQALHDFFAEQGYELLMDKKQFRKNTATGFVNVIFSVTQYAENDAWIEVHLGCRNQHIEQIAQQFLTDNLLDFRDEANTLIISIGKYNKVKYFRYKIQSDEDIQITTDSIKDFLQTTGFGFLESIKTLADVEKTINAYPSNPCPFLYNQTHRCFKGIIAAKLNSNKHLQGLTNCYVSYLEKFGRGEDCARFQRLLAYLQHYSAN